MHARYTLIRLSIEKLLIDQQNRSMALKHINANLQGLSQKLTSGLSSIEQATTNLKAFNKMLGETFPLTKK